MKHPLLTLDRLTAPHFLAYSFCLDMLGPEPKRVLDFGSRYSLLPTILAMAGHDVVATDRDPGVVNWQAGLAREHGVKFPAYDWHPGSPEQLTIPKLDAITACWSIQHNEPETQAALIAYLGRMLKSGGSLIVVNALGQGQTEHMTNREDPLWRLTIDDMQSLLIDPSGLVLKESDAFRYEHATRRGEWCPMHEGNAIAYRLEKP